MVITYMTNLSARAPGRVELLGNHTDYNEGVVLAAAINHWVTVHGKPISGDRIVLRSTSAGQPVDMPLTGFQALGEATSWANYPLGVVSCLQQEKYPVQGFDMSVDSDLPTGAGLSSSAALEVATACLLMKLFALEIEPLHLAKLCRRAENEFVGVQCGLLDQVSSIFGKRGQAVYLDCRSEVVENIPLPEKTSLLVFHCGVAHQLTGGEYNERREQCFAAARALGVKALRDVSSDLLEKSRGLLDPVVYRRAAHIVGEDERVFAGIESLRKGDAPAFGELMFASHESSRVNFENSTRELDILVELAHGIPGVLGSRLTGGGFGGATISLVERDAAEEVATRLAAEYQARTGIEGRAYLCESADGAA
jgi:galactokinase